MSGPKTAVLMAGGEGRRLRPLTYAIPKPLLPVGRKPIAQIIVEQLRDAGWQRIILSVGYRAELFRAYFQDGRALGVGIEYVQENKPLGTAGSLRLAADRLDDDFLVMNGDILTTQDLGAFFEHHLATRPAATVAVRRHNVPVPFGVLEVADGSVAGVREKPEFEITINAGIYALSPETLALIPPDRKFDMTDLINRCLDESRPVSSFEIKGEWYDIAKIDDLEQVLHNLPHLR